jgi:hypothetical protein
MRVPQGAREALCRGGGSAAPGRPAGPPQPVPRQPGHERTVVCHGESHGGGLGQLQGQGLAQGSGRTGPDAGAPTCCFWLWSPPQSCHRWLLPLLRASSAAASCHSSPLAPQDEGLFPWHDPPVPSDARPMRDGPDARVWRAMYALGARSPLIPRLLRYGPGPAPARAPPAAPVADSEAQPAAGAAQGATGAAQGASREFPGSGFLALRLLAFFFSWLRYHFTPVSGLHTHSPALCLPPCATGVTHAGWLDRRWCGPCAPRRFGLAVWAAEI